MRRLVLSALFVLGPSLLLIPQDYKVYQNYDFVPGDRIIFEDDFRGDTDGEFPAHWSLLSGQAVVNKLEGSPMFALTEGNYAKVEPRIKGKDYLSDPFTVEFDFFLKADSSGYLVTFLSAGEDEKLVCFGQDVHTEGLDHDLSAAVPGDAEHFKDTWHHAALALKKNQMKCYIDQYRVLVIPDVGFQPKSVRFGGIGSAEAPLIFKNVRIASGGGMNLIDKLTKEGRIVTHGILFDVNQSTIKPQSMGTISEMVQLLKSNPDLKLEIGGHTDSDGDAARNLTLSQARADAVKQLLAAQGIEASRLTTKGYGATKPLDSNATPEGKANNRRVEFTKI
jgi:outer membrane protein OmpA-like peptidoglycan-associated protein